MTLGEKIKNARKDAGLTQEQLAQKLVISRQAITKWENDKGIPDIVNLKAIAKLLNVSIDYLLDDGEDAVKTVIRESIDLSAYGKGGFNDKRKDILIREKYPDAEIINLLADHRSNKEKVLDNIIGFATDAPFGLTSVIDGVRNEDNEYFLITNGAKQYICVITNEFIETRELPQIINDKKFTIGDVTFKRFRKVK